jgi:hypothetical protein
LPGNKRAVDSTVTSAATASDFKEPRDTRDPESPGDYDRDRDDRDDHDEGSSSEDELIQKVLGHRIKHESSQKSIEEDSIANSDDEDVVSMCRRLRWLYGTVKEQRLRIDSLEAQLKPVVGK